MADSMMRACILGGAASGKTEALVQRATDYIERRGYQASAGAQKPSLDEQGTSKILILAASPEAADFLRARLSHALGTDEEGLAAQGMRVTTPRALALGILSNPNAQAACGRKPRLLLPFEENILLEDVKASGVRPKRLREMLKFFYRSWTELADDDPAWLVSDEELQVHALIKECLAFSGGILPCELSNLAVHWLRASPRSCEEASYGCVLVDDYQLLSRASQELAELVAREALVVTGDPEATSEVFEAYPYAQGLTEFAQADGVEVTELETRWNAGPVRACCAALIAEAQECEQGCTRADAPGENHDGSSEQYGCRTATTGDHAGGARALAFPSPQDEFAYIARNLADVVAAGTSPAGFYLAVPNSAWAKSLSHSLAARGVRFVRKPNAHVLNGDTRDLGRCRTARLFTLLTLAADSRDALAWRSWCGFGDWLAENPGFAALRRCAARQGLGLYEALEALETGNLPQAGAGELDAAEEASLTRIAQAFADGRAALAKLSGLTGKKLVDAAWDLLGAQEADSGPCKQDIPSEMLDLLGVLDTSQPLLPHDAAGMVGHLLGALYEPSFPGSDTEAVRIGSLADAHGRMYTTVVLTGFVNGFIPKHAYFDPTKTPLDRMGALRAADLRRVYEAAGHARKNLLVTAFTQTEALAAERLDLKIDRILMRDGVRLARISPSDLIAAMGLGIEEVRP